ncbi:MAG: SdrD B-like domain-containing protein, partial [Acidobacteriota bacterium]
WLDANLNGVQDGGESGFAGVVVELFDASGLSLGTTTTDAGGAFAFADLGAGDYYLGFSEPAGFCFTARDQGTDDGADSDVDPESLTTALFGLAPGQDDTSRDAGLVPDASIGNRVWLDDGDGIQAGNEPGLADVAVNLYDAGAVLVASTTTDASGGYAFSPGPGDYYLEVLLPAETAFAPRDQGADDTLDSDVFITTGTTAIFTLAPGAVDATRDAGLEPTVIGNRVWHDRNADGLQQPDEAGRAGVEVHLLSDAGLEVASTTTDGEGVYHFLGIPSGTYRIEVIAPTGGVFSTPDAGGSDADLVDSDVDPSTGQSVLFEYIAGTANQRWDAGLHFPPLFADGFESGDFSAWTRVSQ